MMSNPERAASRPVTIPSQTSDFSDLFSGNYYPIEYGASPVRSENDRSMPALARTSRITSRSSYSDDIVKVEITDLECNSSSNVTIGALRRCKRDIVSPFYNFLKFVGWRQFGYSRVSFGSKWWRIFNFIYFLIILMLLLFNYIFQSIACKWRRNTENDDPDMILTTTTVPPTLLPNASTTVLPWLSLRPALPRSTLPPNKTSGGGFASLSGITCQHFFTSYILPNILHFIAYILGFIHFRLRRNEDLDGLMEKVFLYCESAFTRDVSQRSIIRRLKSLFYMMLAWILLAICTHAICEVCTWKEYTKIKFSCPTPLLILFGIDMIGTVIAVGVSMTIILNYIVNCELIIFYAKSVMTKLRERTLNLRVAIKDLYQINIAAKRLNETTALVTSLVLLIFLEKIVIGTTIILKLHRAKDIVWIYRALYIIHPIPVVLLAMIQAARVNAFYNRFLRTVLEIRTFGYQNAPQIELDSVVLFSKANKFRAKLFFVPIRTSYLVLVTVITAFIFLLLIQNGFVTKNAIV